MPAAMVAWAPKLNYVKLAYWDIRGLAQISRLLLSFFGVEFEDYHYNLEKVDGWFKEDKLKLGLDFPNLPYLVSGDFNMSESGAI